MRSLILAGGGLKVAFQAGVLQVWLDEAGIVFDHADGASGGCFNLAMYCQGMSGTRIADNWRTLDPFLPVTLNTEDSWRIGQAPSLFTYDSFRTRVLPGWGIDWTQINASARQGTFTLFNFSKKRLEVVAQDRIDEDKLISAVSLPMWFPPVVIDGDTYIDAVYVCDANVEEAIRRGADEIWAIWTVSTKDEWRPGFVNQYFQIIETTADANFFAMWRRIEKNNEQIAAGQAGEFGRRIELKLLQAEVPLHYLINLSRDRMAEAVNLGVQAARQWCDARGVALPNRGPDIPPTPPVPVERLQFTEEMKGQVADQPLRAHFTIDVADVNTFVTNPQHEAALQGFIESPLVGSRATVETGRFNLFVQTIDPTHKEMRYRAFCRRANGTECTLVGVKRIEATAPHSDVWSATTTLHTTLFEGRIDAAGEAGAVEIGRGIIRIEFFDFLQQLTTFKVEGPSVAARIQAMSRFGQLFLGKLWDVYGRQFAGPGAIG